MMETLRSILHLKSAFQTDFETIKHPNDPARNFTVYREKQVKEMCALHSLNNLFQEKFFTKQTLDMLCNDDSSVSTSTTFFNPNRSVFGTGNYNVSVILKAVQLREHQCIWFNKTKFVAFTFASEPDVCCSLDRSFAGRYRLSTLKRSLGSF